MCCNRNWNNCWNNNCGGGSGCGCGCANPFVNCNGCCTRTFVNTNTTL